MFLDFAPVKDIEDERLRRKRRAIAHICKCRVCQPDAGRDVDVMEATK